MESAQSATGSEARANNTLGGDNSGMSNQFDAMYGNVNTTNIYGVEPPVDTRERRRGKGHLGRRGLVVAVVCLLVAAAVPLLLEAWGTAVRTPPRPTRRSRRPGRRPPNPPRRRCRRRAGTITVGRG